MLLNLGEFIRISRKLLNSFKKLADDSISNLVEVFIFF